MWSKILTFLAGKWGIALVAILVVGGGLSTVFIKYSIARRNAIIADLAAQNIKKDAKIGVLELEVKKERKRAELAQLQKKDKETEKKRESIQAEIGNLNKDLAKASEKLVKARKDVRNIKDNKKLIEKATNLLKDTL